MFKKKITKLSLDELAKVMPVIEEWEMRTMVGGTGGYVTKGTPRNPYTVQEMDTMMDSGTWKGGYVEDMGWVSTGVAVFSGGDGKYYTFSDYIRSNTNNAFLMSAIGALPGIGDYLGYINTRYSNLHTNIHADLLDKGYDSTSSFYIDVEDGRSNANAIIIKVYDAHNGNLILTRSMAIF